MKRLKEQARKVDDSETVKDLSHLTANEIQFVGSTFSDQSLGSRVGKFI